MDGLFFFLETRSSHVLPSCWQPLSLTSPESISRHISYQWVVFGGIRVTEVGRPGRLI